jgi:lysozyme family protein
MPPFRLSDVEREGMIDRLIRREGQYVNHPSDRGGPTNYGVTQIAIDDYNSLMGMEGGA